MGLIELFAPRVEVGAARLVGVVTFAGALVMVSVAIETTNIAGIAASGSLALASAFLVTADSDDLLGTHGIVTKALYFSLVLVAGYLWFLGA